MVSGPANTNTPHYRKEVSKAAREIVRMLPAGAALHVLVARDVAEEVQPDAIPLLAIDDRRANMSVAMNAAVEWLVHPAEASTSAAAARRRLVVISDFTRGSYDVARLRELARLEGGSRVGEVEMDWVDVAAPLAGTRGLIPGHRVTFVRGRWIPGGDKATGALEVDFGVVATTGSRERMEVVLQRVGPKDGQLVEMARTQVSPDEQGGVVAGRMRVANLSREPLILGSVSIEPPDTLPVDDRAYFAVEPTRGPRVVIVNGDPVGRSFRDESFYAERALSADVAQEIRPHVRVVTPAELPQLDLARDVDVLIALNVAAEEIMSIPALNSWLTAGGGLLIFAGDRANAGSYNSQTGAFFPARVAGVRAFDAATAAASAGVLLLAPTEPHPATDVLRSFGAREIPGTVTRKRVDVEEAQGKILLTFSDGGPALIAREVGRGAVMFFATTADRDWTDIPLSPAFPALLERMVAVLAGGQSARTLHARLVSREHPFAGIFAAGRSDAANSEAYCVNADPEEGDLTRIVSELSLASSRGSQAAPAATVAPDTQAHPMATHPLWSGFLLAAALLLVAEAAVRFTHSA